MKLRRKLGGAALLLLLGCGSSPFTVNGSIHGNSLKPGDAISAHGVLLMGGDPIHATVAVLSNASGLCSLADAGKLPKSSQFLTLTVGDQSTSTPPAAGTYVIWSTGALPTLLALADYWQTDASCSDIPAASATSGTITVTSVSNGHLSGTFDLTFDSGDHVTGSFSAPDCETFNVLATCT